jgi:hypothetical protein
MNFSSSCCLSPYPWFRQWLVRAAFVALTVAGQQGIPRKAKGQGIKDEFFFHPFSLCRYPLRSHPFPLIRLQPIFYLVNANIRPFSDEELAKGTMTPRNRRLCGLLGKD